MDLIMTQVHPTMIPPITTQVHGLVYRTTQVYPQDQVHGLGQARVHQA